MRRLTIFDSCGPLRPLLWDYVTGKLPAGGADALRVESHLARCPACRAEAQQFRTAASAIDVYKAAPETGIPPRAPNWAGVQALLAEPQKEPAASPANRPWLQAMRTSPGFAGVTIACGLCTALCAVSIPLTLKEKSDRRIRESLPIPASKAVDRRRTTAEAKANRVRTAAVAPVEMVVSPVFNGGLNGYGVTAFGTFPLAATVVNRTGKATEAHFSVVGSNSIATRHYERSVLLNESPKPQIVLLYPSVIDNNYSRPELQIALRGEFPTQESRVSYSSSYQDNSGMAFIGDAGYGALLPKQQVIAAHRQDINRLRPNNYYQEYKSYSVKPESAPDRPVGYGCVQTLVLGYGAERLNPNQKAALRQWVIGGGAVILLPGAGLDLLGLSSNLPSVAVKPVSRLLPPETPLRRYALGMGTALTVGCDLTQSEYREHWELSSVWDELQIQSRVGTIVSPIDINENALYSSFGQIYGDGGPFQVALPPLATVVYLFTGYFLLAVPVTFVILKRTQRMNWAWATGPVLAALFGGLVYGFTADLHRAKLSRRTGGVLLSMAGETKARFVGTSELFFPTSGQYDATVPGAETMALESSSLYQSAAADPYNDDLIAKERESAERGGIVPRSLETIDNGTSVSVPALNVPNLAFRRLDHAQPASWGEGITTHLTRTREGRVVGTIYNGTGRTLRNAYILMQNSTMSVETKMQKNRSFQRSYLSLNTVLVNEIHSGINRIDQKTTLMDSRFNSDFGRIPGGTTMLRSSYSFYRSGASPVLVATTSGEDLGPTIGQYVGGQNSVMVGIALPPIPIAGSSVVQGGVK